MRNYLRIGFGLVLLGCIPIPCRPADLKIDELIKKLAAPVKAHRLESMQKLGNLGTAASAAIPALSDHLRHHKDKELADRAALTLAQIGPAVVPELIKALHDESPAVRKRGLWALAILGPLAGQAIPAVTRFLKDDDQAFRALAARVLAEMGPEARAAALPMARALRDPDAQVRWLAARALHALGSERVTDLLPLLRDDDLAIRLGAVGALAIFHERPEAIRGLVAALHDRDMQVRSVAAWALVSLGPQARPALPAPLKCLREPNVQLQTLAYAAIMAIGAHEDTCLLDQLMVANENDRWAAPYVLKQYGTHPGAALRPLGKLLGDRTAMHRLGAALALGKLGQHGREAGPQLLKLLKDNCLAVRAAAVVALPAIDPRRKQDPKMFVKLIADIQDDLKADEELDPDKFLQFYILLATFTSSGFPAEQAELRQQVESAMKWAARTSDRLRPVAVPALVRAINVSAQFQLAFTEPVSRLLFTLQKLVEGSQDIPALCYAFENLDSGITRDSPYWLPLAQARFRVLTDSSLLDMLILEKQVAIVSKQLAIVSKKQQDLLKANRERMLMDMRMNLARGMLVPPHVQPFRIHTPHPQSFTPGVHHVSIQRLSTNLLSGPVLPHCNLIRSFGWDVAVREGNKVIPLGPDVRRAQLKEKLNDLANKKGAPGAALGRPQGSSVFGDGPDMPILGKPPPAPQPERELRLLLQIKLLKLIRTTNHLEKELWTATPAELLAKLQDPEPLLRWLAANIIGLKRIPAHKELIARLDDPVLLVREAAHRALVRLGRATDFGPQPLDSPAKTSQAIAHWNGWLDLQDPIAAAAPRNPVGAPANVDLNFELKEKKK